MISAPPRPALPADTPKQWNLAAAAHPDVERAQEAMTALTDVSHKPDEDRAVVYDLLFTQYRKLHDAFGGVDAAADLGGVMKELLRIREAATG